MTSDENPRLRLCSLVFLRNVDQSLAQNAGCPFGLSRFGRSSHDTFLWGFFFLSLLSLRNDALKLKSGPCRVRAKDEDGCKSGLDSW